MGNNTNKINRTIKMVSVLSKYGFEDIISRSSIEKIIPKKFVYANEKMDKIKSLSVYERIRMVISDLGPTYIKLGQLFSDRDDLLPSELTSELKKLQNNAGEDFINVREKIGKELQINPDDFFEFIDSKPPSLFSQLAQDMKKVSYLESGYRDPRKYVDINDLANFRTEVVKFIETAKISKNIEKFAQKAKWIKCANILANVGISSFLLAGVLPKLQYEFNKLITGSYADPGLRKQ